MEKSPKDNIIKSLTETGDKIVAKFEKDYPDFLIEVAEELGECFSVLLMIINKEDQETISDEDFQAALLFWSASNTILSAVELFRKGYLKEPLMLLRNAVEVFCAAYELHIKPEKLKSLQNLSKEFNSPKSVTAASKIHPFVGQMYGLLSKGFTHVSTLHTVPHESSTPLCIGGLLDDSKKGSIIFALAAFQSAIYVLSSLLEITFIKEIKQPRHWKIVDNITAIKNPLPEIRAKQEKVMENMRLALQKL